jgi:putative lipoprotein
MRRLVLAACSALALTGCGRTPARPAAEERPSPAVAAPAEAPIPARFECDDALVVTTFHDDRVVLELAGRTLTLPQAISGSGARYSDGVSTFWNKGNEATLELDGRTQSCRAVRDPWQEARARGIDFRALGQEPGWYLEIDHGKSMRLLYDYAEQQATMPVPEPVSTGGVTTYDAVTELHHLRVLIEERACSDVMSGEAFPRTVTVEIDGRALHGCGRPL